MFAGQERGLLKYPKLNLNRRLVGQSLPFGANHNTGGDGDLFSGIIILACAMKEESALFYFVTNQFDVNDPVGVEQLKRLTLFSDNQQDAKILVLDDQSDLSQQKDLAQVAANQIQSVFTAIVPHTNATVPCLIQQVIFKLLRSIRRDQMGKRLLFLTVSSWS